jgi:small redox-active disulfide protein 2
MKIEILGMCCAKCQKLAENVAAAVKELNSNAEVVKVGDMNRIVELGVLTVPALVVDDKVVSVGKVLTREEIKKIISVEKPDV